MEHCLNTVVDDYYEPVRKGIHNKVQEYKYGPGADSLSDIFKYRDQSSYDKPDDSTDTTTHKNDSSKELATSNTILYIENDNRNQTKPHNHRLSHMWRS